VSADGSFYATNAAEAFVAFLSRQREEYRFALPSRIARIDELWSMIEQDTAAADDRLELERQAHSIAGTGATFGFRPLSAAAKRLELQLQDNRARDLDLIERVRIAYAINDIHQATP